MFDLKRVGYRDPVLVASTDGVGAKIAQERVESLGETAIIGNIYTGKVVRIADFGAFVEILPGVDGLVHISQLDTERVNKVEDVVSMGDEITVMVTDTIGPALTVPANATLEATAATGAVFTYTASAADAVDGDAIASCTPPTGATFPLGTTTVTCTATDTRGNTGTTNFLVTVADTTPPAITVPANTTMEATGATGALVSFSASATDAVDGAVATTCTPASGATFALGATTVTCTAADARGNIYIADTFNHCIRVIAA